MDERATEPEQLSQFILTRLNAGDVEGVVALYEPTAALVLPDGSVANGTEQIRAFYARLLAGRPTFAPGQPRPTLVNGDLARRQPDGTWLWVMDNPNFVPAGP